jgi:ankyrin repeat protein
MHNFIVGCVINTKNEMGNSALHQAMMRDNIDMILLLLKNGADCESFNDYNESPVFYASNRVLLKFGLQNKRAIITSQYDGVPNNEKFINDKRIKLNLRPKRDE